MSKCISRHGEYSEHDNGDDYTCRLCFVFDEDAALAEIARLRTALARVTDDSIRRWIVRYLSDIDGNARAADEIHGRIRAIAEVQDER